MELKLPKERAQQIGLKKLEAFGVGEHTWGWRGSSSIDLRRLTVPKLRQLKQLLQENKDVHGVKMMLYDLGCYERMLADPAAVDVRSIRTFGPLLQSFFKPVARHHVYIKDEDDENVRYAYYVNEIEYHPPRRSHDGLIPAYVTMEVVWDQYGGRHTKRFEWHQRDVKGKTIAAILAESEIYPANDEFRQQYEAEVGRYTELVKQVGKQYLATGTATDDCDGNDVNTSSWRWSRSTLPMQREDGPSKVVIDVFYEGDKPRERGDDDLRRDFWKKVMNVGKAIDDDDDVEQEALAREEQEFETGQAEDVIEIPIHPFVTIFDLRRHLRLRIHVNNLTEYVYDTEIAEKLILPPESKHLVHILVEHREGGFKDIMRGKGGGAIVLLCGPPGTGKTLTAEVFAESEERPLYSVQASQLGTDEESLEKELMKVLGRGRRWGAVMLIDEADVYVHTRGNDLRQNAIVGVFLRVLEYHSSILFLTTNRPDLVDDAIASRCVARITYEVPSLADQRQIWRVLADTMGVKMTDATIAQITNMNSHKRSGRDVKNLLKLAQLFIASGDRIEADAKTIEFVEQFKPTGE